MNVKFKNDNPMEKAGSEQLLSPQNILICGNYGASNLGDEAILEGIIELCNKAFPQASITVMSSSPEATETMHHVSSVPLFPSGCRSLLSSLGSKDNRTQQALLKADLFILGGGGLFTDEKWRAVWIWFLQARKAFRAGKPVICLGQSVGPLKTWSGRFLARQVFRQAALTTVRDNTSFQQLEELGITGAKVLADPAFLLQSMKTPKEHKPYVVMAVRPWLSKTWSGQHQTLAHMVDWLYEKYQLSCYLYPFQNASDDDRKVLADIIAQVKHPEAARLLDYSPNFYDALEVIGQATAVIGMRLHSLIFSTLETTPFLALSYSSKVSGLLKDLGMSEYCLDWEHLTLVELQQKFSALMDNRETVAHQFTQKRKEFRELALKHVELLKDCTKV